MTTALTVRGPGPLTPSIWNMIQTLAPVIHKSRLLGAGSPEQAATIMLKGFELGLPFAASFEFIHVVQGKPTLSPRGALALIQRSDELETIEVAEAPGSCTVRMKRKNGFDYSLTFTMEDAKRTGQVKSGSAWESYPANMLRWRCIGFVADVVFPDVIGGLRRADELGAMIDASGDFVDGDWSVVDAPAELPTTPVVTLDGLEKQYGAEAVMAAAGGQIPQTQDELVAVAALLAADAVPF